jgi:hypothetical protein
MVKYKPIEFDIFPPKMLIENQVNSLYTFSKMSQRIIDETRGFICGNPTCRQETVINEKVAWIPRRCLVCGEEFDWENILTETKKYCPLCHEKYPGYANFCGFHNDPKIGLIPS